MKKGRYFAALLAMMVAISGTSYAWPNRGKMMASMMNSRALSGTAGNRQRTDQTQPPLSKKELKALIRNPRTATDHRRITAYYRWKARRLLQGATEHQQLADAYANRTLFEPKTGIPGGLYEHCRHWAAVDERDALKMDSLAEVHDRLAAQQSGSGTE